MDYGYEDEEVSSELLGYFGDNRLCNRIFYQRISGASGDLIFSQAWTMDAKMNKHTRLFFHFERITEFHFYFQVLLRL
jgi:hypothetical protein